MIVQSSCPTRISLAGGGSDLPVFFSKHGGVVVSLAINIRQNMLVGVGEKVGQKLPEGSSPEFYKTICREMGFYPEKVSVQATFEGKIQSGLGTSASAAVSLVSALAKAKSEPWDQEALAELAWDIEVNRAKMYGGKQDQYAAAFGGLNTIYFENSGVRVEPWSKETGNELNKRLLLFHTGTVRSDTKIQEELVTLSDQQTIELEAIRTNALSLIGGLQAGDWPFVGHIMNKGWEHKKKSNPKVTTPALDRIYDTALLSGAYGGKLCGSGGGGYFCFLVPENKQESVTFNLVRLGCIPTDFSVDWQGVSTRIL